MSVSTNSSSPPSGSPGSPAELWAGAGDFARSVSGRDGAAERLQRAVDLVVELVGGCDHAGVTIARGGRLSTPAASDATVEQGDAWQYELGQGPCLDSVALEHTVISQDLRTERRWPRWSARVQDSLGVRAMMSLLLFTESDTYGALNLYSDRPRVWSDDDIGLAYVLAGHLATSFGDALEIAHRARAMTTRTVIGQAEGLLMERFGVDADQAFAYLRRMSQTTHTKLAVVAEDLVRTRQLPGALANETDSAASGAAPGPVAS